MWKWHIDHIQICTASMGNESPEEVSVVYPPTTDIETPEPATGNTQ